MPPGIMKLPVVVLREVALTKCVLRDIVGRGALGIDPAAAEQADRHVET